MENQPILNIGCLGSVSHGKSTMVYQLTGTKTQRHSDEKYVILQLNRVMQI